ncbi:glucosyltransferase domain-containing protein [Butyrivibrio sp. TB]|uniref:glucosyltransferase domain-containing protein n=1 Tax=Butyrivibrio sp. TB TaxID=1520809 RepID=UPI0008AD8261|nr:glucosyltransferase domain-containing protein [Butyrivibrio sp. TB]SEQ23192.1 Glucosyl transferase GtrII [Butyrivibrio sp. TB]
MKLINIKYLSDRKNEIIKITLLILCYFGLCVFLNFATDTYVVFDAGFKGAGKDMLLRNGRPIIGLFYYLFDILKISNENVYRVSAVLSLIFLELAIFIYSNQLIKYIENENIRILISFVSVANLYIIEYFMFIEKFGFMLAILLNVIAACKMNEFFRERKKLSYIQAIVCSILSALTYQGVMALYIILCMPLVFVYAKFIKTYITNLLLLIVPYFVSAAMTVLLFLFTGSKRTSLNEGYLANIKHTVSAFLHFLYDTFGLMPKFFVGVVFLLLLAIVLLLAMKCDDKVLRLLHLMIMVIIAVIFPLATLLQGSGWNAMRVVYPLASMIGMLLLELAINYNNEINRISSIKIIINALLIIFFAFQYISFNKIYIDKNKNDMADMVRAQFIGNEIREYESTTGNKIEKIAFYYDSSPSYPCYSGLYYNRDMVVSLFYTHWSDVLGINYYLQEEYRKAEPSEKYNRYFSEFDWDSISSEQLVFEKNTLHICNY